VGPSRDPAVVESGCQGEFAVVGVSLGAALREQLELEDEGFPATVELGHAAVRFTNPTTGGDVLPTIRCEFHRLRPGISTRLRHEAGSSVWQVFEGTGTVTLGGVDHQVGRGDLFVVPSWVSWSLTAETGFDLFRFSDGPIFDRLHFARTHIPGSLSGLDGISGAAA
jgi:gentisate 1,2-dioxygenase